MAVELSYSDVRELPSSRSEALRLNQTIYYTGLPCKHGHIAVRYVHSGCSVCRNLICDRSYRSKPHNKDKARMVSRVWYKQNHQRNLDTSKNWRDDNTTKVLTQCAKRRAIKKQAIPKWEDASELNNYVNELYEEAKMLKEQTGIDYQVDHIVPLNSKIVCGLHCKNNLRVITAEENNKKKNKLLEHLL